MLQRLSLTLAGVALVAGALLASPPQGQVLGIDDVRPGMVGTGRTVFAGDAIEEFKATILGTLRNVIAPGRNLIIAKLEGGPLASTGVIAGMSGSPVYIDGKLIGAVSYSLGSFAKEPFAGITPIGEMIDAVDTPGPRGSNPGLALPPGATAAQVFGILRRAMAGAVAPLGAAGAAADLQGASSLAALVPELRPIGSALVLSGIDPGIGPDLRHALSADGVPDSSGNQSSRPAPTGPLRPGDPVGVSLVRGDLEMGATGTVTLVNGTRVYAFGHPFLNLGPTTMVMTRADVIGVLPSLDSSLKIATLGAVVGTMNQDRAVAIGGTLGPGPKELAMTITMTSARAPERRFKVFVLQDQLLTPLFSFVTVLNAISAYERQVGTLSLRVTGSLSFGSDGQIAFDDFFAGDAAASMAAGLVAGPMSAAATNEFRVALPQTVDLRIHAVEQQNSATIERVWLDTTKPKFGATHQLQVLLRDYRGGAETVTIPVTMPAQASGPLTLLVSDGATLASLEQRELRVAKPTSFEGLIAQLNLARHGNRVYATLLRQSPGTAINGENLSALPPSAQSILDADKSVASSTIGKSVVGSWDKTLDRAVRGSRELTITFDLGPMIRRPVLTLRRTLPLSLAAIAAALTLAATLRASGPVFWTTLGAGDLLRGTSDGVFVSLDGVVTAGPQLTARLTSTPAQIWSLAAGPDGTLWAGTGGDGRLLRVRPGQPEETVATTKETGVFAIAVAGPRVYYGTAPDGRVYLAEGAAAPRVFFDPQEKYIWALAVDAGGRLWVGAGNPAAIYRVDPDGTSKLVYRPPAAHVVSLALDARGNVLAGTESPGRVYRFDASDRPYVLLDSEMTELRAIAVGRDGSIFAAAISRGDDAAAPGGESTSIAAALPPPPSTGSSGSAAAGGSASASRRSVIYRIDPSGSWETFWETQDTLYDVAADADGGVLAASGPEGRVYKITRTQQVHLLTGVDAKQITRLLTAPTGLTALATANPGRVIAASAVPQSPATYLSPVRDTKSASTWGTVRWESTAGVELFSRSGNTDKADDSWSEWAGPYTHREGELIKSPPARYLQWKSVLTRSGSSPAPQLTSVTVAYLPRNTRPVVSPITVYPPGVVFQRPFGGDDTAIAGLDDATADARRPPGDSPPPPSPGKRMYQKGLQTLTWKGDDNDGDRLTYSVLYRREGVPTWRELKADWGDSIVVWDTTSVPDGRYIVKVVASDGPSNAGDRALTGERESTLVDVDNTPPVLSTEVSRQAGAIHVLVRAHDAQSPIAKLEYSLGGGRWVAVYPVDGTADSPDERFDITVANDADLARMVIRAFDTLQNVATQPAVVR